MSLKKLWLAGLMVPIFALSSYGMFELNEILNDECFWRVATVWETQEYYFPDETIQHAAVDGSGDEFSWTNPWNEEETRTFSATPRPEIRIPENPPEDWMQNDFDDSEWPRQRGPFFRNSGDVRWKIVKMRGLFTVENLAMSGRMTLNMKFKGGAVVYLNGEEITRAYMPDGPVDSTTPALPYPQDVYFNEKGEYVGSGTYRASQVTLDVQAKRWREIEDFSITSDMMQEGVNVLAVALHRAPCDFTYSFHARSGGRGRGTRWAKIGLNSLKLIAQPGSAIVPNLGPDEHRVKRNAVQQNTGPLRDLGFHLRNQSLMQRVSMNDYPDPYAPLQPLNIVGVRNGIHSAQFLVGHGQEEIEGLTVKISDFEGPAVLPADTVTFRFARPDGSTRRGMTRWFDSLENTPPRRIELYPEQGAALQPVWLNLAVPEDAEPGDYSATITVEARFEDPLTLPVKLRVHDWRLPDPQDYGSSLDLAQSPESVALAYDVELWSDRHFELLDHTFRHMSRMGVKNLYITGVRRTHFGNEHAMVRWVRDEEGYLQPDLTIVEKYLDAAMKHLGKIPAVVLYCWEPPESMGHAGGTGQAHRTHDRDILITMYDPDSGELSGRMGPAWGTQESQEFWKRLTDAMRAVLRERGIEDSLLFGLAGDHRPTQVAMDDIGHGMDDPLWAVHSHYYCDEWQGYKMGLTVALWGVGYSPADPLDGYGFGWSNPHWVAYFPREMNLRSSTVEYRTRSENRMGGRRGRTPFMMTGRGVRGLGRLGVDFWRVVRDGRGRITGSLAGIYPETAWGQLTLNNGVPHVLSQGESHPIPTTRSEAFREGAQEMEARIYIEKALLDTEAEARLGQDLIDQCRETLDERIRIYKGAAGEGQIWFISSGWRERADRLYALAAKVATRFEDRAPVLVLDPDAD